MNSMFESKAARRRSRRGCLVQSSCDPGLVVHEGLDKLLRLEGKVGTLMEKMMKHEEFCEEVEVRLALLEKVFLFVDIAKLNAGIGRCCSDPDVLADELDSAFTVADDSEAIPRKLQLDKLLMMDELEKIPSSKTPPGLELLAINAEDEDPDAYDGFDNFTGAYQGVGSVMVMSALEMSAGGSSLAGVIAPSSSQDGVVEEVADGDQLREFAVVENLQDDAVGGQLTAVRLCDAPEEDILQSISVIFQDFQTYYPGVDLTDAMKKTIVNQVAELHGLSKQFIEKGFVLSNFCITES